MIVVGGQGKGGKAHHVQDEYLYFLMLPWAVSVKIQDSTESHPTVLFSLGQLRPHKNRFKSKSSKLSSAAYWSCELRQVIKLQFSLPQCPYPLNGLNNNT